MKKKKLGRNEHCWCGSGKKFKKCHLNREEQEPMPPWDADKQFRDNWSKKTCLAPADLRSDCNGRIIRAHTVPRSGSLKNIARDGHVYSFLPSIENLRADKGKLRPRLLGLKKASTFTGFCAHHDNSIFAPLEDEGFSGSPEQCFLLGYRALAKEVYNKEAAFETNDVLKQLDKGRSLDHQQRIQELAFLNQVGLAAALNDNEYHKGKYDQVLSTRDFSDARAYVVELEHVPSVMWSGGYFPEQDFDGQMLQDVGDITRKLDHLSATSFASGNSGYVVFSWLKDSDTACLKLIRSLDAIDDNALPNALLRFAFEHLENCHLSPNWWESLSNAQQNAIIDRMSQSANPFATRRKQYLLDDGVRLANWKVCKRYTVGFCI